MLTPACRLSTDEREYPQTPPDGASLVSRRQGTRPPRYRSTSFMQQPEPMCHTLTPVIITEIPPMIGCCQTGSIPGETEEKKALIREMML